MPVRGLQIPEQKESVPMNASNVKGTLILVASDQLYVEATEATPSMAYSPLEAGELRDARSAKFPHDRVMLNMGIVRSIVEGRRLGAGPTSYKIANGIAVVSITLVGFKKAVVRMFTRDELEAALKFAPILDKKREEIGNEVRQAFGQTEQQAEKPARPPQGNQGKREDKRPNKPNGKAKENQAKPVETEGPEVIFTTRPLVPSKHLATPEQRPHTTFSELPEFTDETREARVEAIANQLAAAVPSNPSAEEVILTDEATGVQVVRAGIEDLMASHEEQSPDSLGAGAREQMVQAITRQADAVEAKQPDLSFEELVALLSVKGREFVAVVAIKKAGHTYVRGKKIPATVVAKIIEQQTAAK